MNALIDSPAWATAKPRVSVLTPFLRDDPSILLADLDAESAPLNGAVELVLLDDGTGDEELTARLTNQIRGLGLPVRLISLSANVGRAEGRNQLAAAARGQFLLFLDSDMRPDGPSFLRDWLALADDQTPAVAFGGFSLKQASDAPRFAVHRAVAARSECVPAVERRLAPEKYVYTSNLLVRRDVFEAEAFDGGFTGWGWEDVEWAIRVSRRFPILHIDNPATHMGLDTVEALAGKYEQAAPNFARMAERHPDVVATYPSFRAARGLKRIPGLLRLKGLLRAAACTGWLPVKLRAFLLRLYRTALYAEAV
ncbi:glycosyltransferase family 2 protein [Brevundimonas sp. NPDC092305]|uniref:glycosyltransferase family 2 protein n=1 Tax=Brevundimonas sp. NPDC092305 TaxID=3363957 RepID=UPI00381035DD